MNWKNQKGTLLIEVMISISLAAVFSLAIGKMISSNHQLVVSSKQEVEAMAYAKESMEQLFAMKQSDWNAIGNVADGYYLIQQNGNTFQLSIPNDPNNPEEVLQDKYYRVVQIGRAYRNAAGELSETGTEDNNARRLDVKVTWSEREVIREISLASYITNWTGQ